ncbi:MAG: tRNA 2-thiouridine synthesizing protein [Actinomycetota bacterium]|jgi:tRNA 2-thiouridine synthesizing protein A|nr:tRNA 2-thiouridine synthesizing protein [Actinomycetota bacterium]
MDEQDALAGRWDAGNLGCGELVLELRGRLAGLSPGSLFELIASDSGAVEDLPSWCRMTGHALVAARHPRYLIRTHA